MCMRHHARLPALCITPCSGRRGCCAAADSPPLLQLVAGDALLEAVALVLLQILWGRLAVPATAVRLLLWLLQS